MKKWVKIVFAIMFLFGLFSVNSIESVQAKSSPAGGKKPGLAEGAWTGGTNKDISSFTATAPEWLQLMTTVGVEVTTPGQICHPFRGGQFGWVAEIRQLMPDGSWKKIDTEGAWLPTEEGTFTACAVAAESGKYALFGHLASE